MSSREESAHLASGILEGKSFHLKANAQEQSHSNLQVSMRKVNTYSCLRRLQDSKKHHNLHFVLLSESEI